MTRADFDKIRDWHRNLFRSTRGEIFGGQLVTIHRRHRAGLGGKRADLTGAPHRRGRECFHFLLRGAKREKRAAAKALLLAAENGDFVAVIPQLVLLRSPMFSRILTVRGALSWPT